MPKKEKKKNRQNILTFLKVYHPKTHIIKTLHSLDSSRLSQNLKTAGFNRILLLIGTNGKP